MNASAREDLRSVGPVGADSWPLGPPGTPLPTPAGPACPLTERPGWLLSGFHCTLDHRLRRSYGMTCADYWRWLQAQGGVCRRCGRPPDPGRLLVVDEDHDTGEVWGLLHFRCNRRISQQDRRYLRTPPPIRQVVPADRRRAAERRRHKKRLAARKRAAAKRTATPTPDPPAMTLADRINQRKAELAKEA